MSRESTLFPGADVVPVTEGSTDGHDTPKVRYERPFDLHDGWKFAPRVEFTAVSTNDGSNPPGTFATGLGDTQFQGVFSKELDAREGVGFGLRFFAPTATDDQFGNGRWRMAPAAGYRYSLPELSQDSYFSDRHPLPV